MRIIRKRSSTKPDQCHMVAKGFLGNTIAEVTYSKGYDIQALGYKPGYFIIHKNKLIGAATNFDHAVDACLTELGVIKDIFV